MCERSLSSKRARRTHFLCQIASLIPFSPLNPPRFASPTAPPPSWSLLSFLILLRGRLCLPSRDTKHWFIPQVKRDPWEHSKTRTSQEAEGRREQVSGSGCWLFSSPHRQMDSPGSHGGRTTHAQIHWLFTGPQMSVGKSVSRVKYSLMEMMSEICWQEIPTQAGHSGWLRVHT